MPADIDELLPLKPIDCLVLLVLHDRERHGYGIVKDIEVETQGKVRLVPGNLYSVLRRLLDDGLICDAGHRQAENAHKERRRLYQITKLGKRVLAAEVERMREVVAAAESRRVVAARHRP